MRFTRPIAAVLLAFVLAAAVGGCAFGPKAIELTHGPYADAVQRVEEEQLLRNIVRIRYVEAPRSLDVASIEAQYELSATAEARPFYTAPNPAGEVFRTFEAILPFASLTGANRPTVSLLPHDDGTSVRQFLTPITAETLAFLAQSGWPASSILRIWVDRLNGVPNFAPSSGSIRDRPADFERFRQACDLIQSAQDHELASIHAEERITEMSGPLPPDAVTAAATVDAAKNGFEYRPRADAKTWALIRRDRKLVLQVNPAGRGSPELAELCALINLHPGADQYDVVWATGVPDPLTNPTAPTATVQVTPRSTAQALFFLADGVEVPPEHIACSLVRIPEGVDPTEATRGLFHVHCCPGSKHRPPKNAYTSIWYRGHWFYIDDRDQESKATLLLMLELQSLDFKKQTIGAGPTLTLPAGR